MNTYIALLKGINVGGHKKVPMAELRELLANIGLLNVQTYIQSGNVVFQSAESNLSLENKIKSAIQSHFEFEVNVLVMTRAHLKRVFDESPFSEDKKKASYFFMLHNTPTYESVNEVAGKIYENENYKIIKDCIYYYYEKGLGKAKFNINYFERRLNTFATARNYNTMVKLLSLSSE